MTMERGNASFGEACLPVFRNRFSERSLKAHEFRPFNHGFFRADAFALHPVMPVDHFGCTDKHLLGIASTQGTGTAERS